ncbi:MAG: penicillin-binding protein 2 [Tannerella sp.]|nr:penicillin-binding protein 2 [Tannerella sp.]
MYRERQIVVIASVFFVLLIFAARLFYLQIIDDEYKQWADSNAFLKKTLYPARGVIYDRNGKLLVYNQPAYDVMLIMREINAFDTLDFCKAFGITKEFFIRRINGIKDRKQNPGYSSYVPQVFISQLSTNEYGMFQEKLYKFPGFYIQNRTIREYGYPNAALLLGNIGQVDRKDIENDRYYTSGDDSGRSGVEYSYEKILRGEKGVEVLLRDVHGRIQGKYEQGSRDVVPVSGKNITLAIDIDLQAYGELLMKNKRGSIVMIEPSTGEVLCMVSSPSYDPGLLVGRQRGQNYAALENDPHKPLFDRSIMGRFSPGSTYKPAQGLVFLQENVITRDKMYTCAHGYTFRSGKPACHGHASPLNLITALSTSCNSYFCWGLHDMLDSRKFYPTVQEAYDVWRNHMISMGYGNRLGIDLPGEYRGYVPDSKFYDNFYKKRWYSSTIISIAIGQGEISTTPLQICNQAATIANRGYYIVPHVVKAIENDVQDTLYTQKKRTTIDRLHYETIAEGMRNAVSNGTCYGLNLRDIEVCGKTGTVENVHGKDHSACMSFAPYKDPKVAISVYVENGGFGASNAIPIARLMLEKFFYGEVKPETKYLETEIINRVILPSNVQ